MKTITKLTTVLALLAPLAATAQDYNLDGDVSFSSGVDYSSGDYGTTTDTDIIYVPFALKYKTDRWSTKLTVPYISIRGTGSVRPEVGAVAASSATRTTESGLGDVVASGTYTFYEDLENEFFADITGKVKFGTADDTKGLGTGEMDYTVQLDVMKVFGDITPMAGFGYKNLGDSSTLTLNNVLTWNVGVDYKVDNRTNIGAFYDWREKATSTSKNQQDASIYLSYKANDNLKLQPYAGMGLSDGSPDLNLGLTFTYTY
jgi:hypothetical protein